MRKTLCLLAAVLTLSGAAAPLRAEDDDKSKDEKPRHERMAAMMKEKLGLSDEQFAKIKDAHKKAAEAIKPLREQLKKAVDKAHGELLIDAPDKDIQAALDQVDKARKALRAEMDKTRAEIDGMLTPKQRVKMLVLHEGMMRGRMMMARHPWGHEGMGPEHHPDMPGDEGPGPGDEEPGE